MKRKFKVEDKVKNVKNLSGFEKDDKYVGKIGIIIYDDHTSTPYEVKFNNGKVIWFKDSELELVKEENQEYVTKAEFEEFKKSIQETKPIEKQEEKPKDRADCSDDIDIDRYGCTNFSKIVSRIKQKYNLNDK